MKKYGDTRTLRSGTGPAGGKAAFAAMPSVARDGIGGDSNRDDGSVLPGLCNWRGADSDPSRSRPSFGLPVDVAPLRLHAPTCGVCEHRRVAQEEARAIPRDAVPPGIAMRLLLVRAARPLSRDCRRGRRHTLLPSS
jgi:hypothetical protein